jgi:hypothetical protein
VKTVTSVGNATIAVKTDWMNLKPAPTCRSATQEGEAVLRAS